MYSHIEAYVLFEPSDTVRQYRDEIRSLRLELERVSALYRQEVLMNTRLTDLFRESGIKWR